MLGLRATDPAGATADAAITISVVDANDPPVFGAAAYALGVAEGVAGRAVAAVGTAFVSDVTDEDNDALMYHLQGKSIDGAIGIVIIYWEIHA